MKPAFYVCSRPLHYILQHNGGKPLRIFCNAPCQNVFRILLHKHYRFQHILLTSAHHALSLLIIRKQSVGKHRHNQCQVLCTSTFLLHLVHPNRPLHNDCILLHSCSVLQSIQGFFRDSYILVFISAHRRAGSEELRNIFIILFLF
jgi:hypothetical protein